MPNFRTWAQSGTKYTLDLDESLPVAHMFLGRVQTKMLAEAVAEFKKADLPAFRLLRPRTSV